LIQRVVRVGPWNDIQLGAGGGPTQSSLTAVIAAKPVLYTIAESPLESLLESLLGSMLLSRPESLFQSLIVNLLDRASHREE
jgi:hypothetical protein